MEKVRDTVRSLRSFHISEDAKDRAMKDTGWADVSL
jgi:hypothetical protein